MIAHRWTVRLVVLSFVVATVLPAASAVRRPVAPEVGSVTSADAVIVRLPELEAGDTVELLLPAGAEAPGGADLWWRKEGAVWRARVPVAGDVGLVLDLSGLFPGARSRITVRRQGSRPDRELQANRSIRRDPSGAIGIGPASAGVVERCVAVRLDPEAAARFPTLEKGHEGWWRIGESDPALEAVLRQAEEARSAIHASVRSAAVPPYKDSVTGSNGWNGDFSDHLCSDGVYYGTSISITTAPADAVVTEFEDEWTVYHSVDISRFLAAMWHRDAPGMAWSDPIDLYGGTSSGDTVYHQVDVHLHRYDGSRVNTDYIIGGCNRYAVETAYVDEWSITLYYDSGSGIDLVADSADPAPSTVAAGGALDLRYSAHVGGSGAVGTAFSTGVYLSTDATIDGSDRRIATFQESGSLSGGDTFGDAMWGQRVTIPADVAQGSYWLGVAVDDGNLVAETEEGNNAVAAPLTVLATSSLPDLTATECSVSPDHANAGDTVRLSFRWRNQGATAAPAFVWEAFLSTDAVFDAGDTPLATMDGGGWPAGYDSTDSMDLVLPASLPDGRYFIGTAVDSSGTVPETNETNNVCTAVLTVGAGGGGATRWLVPAAASAPGYGTSNWKTELAVVNSGSSDRSVTVHYVAGGQSWPGTVLAEPVTLGPSRMLYLDDPLLPMNPTSGLLLVEADGPGIVVTTRTYNLGTDGATFGQGIPAIPLAGSPPASYALPLVHSVSGRFHTNLGLVQTSAGQVRYGVSIVSPSGSVLATRSYTTGAAFRQVNDVFTDMGLGGVSVENAWIVVRLESGNPDHWTCYASVVDDRTGDPTYVMPVAQ